MWNVDCFTAHISLFRKNYYPAINRGTDISIYYGIQVVNIKDILLPFILYDDVTRITQVIASLLHKYI